MRLEAEAEVEVGVGVGVEMGIKMGMQMELQMGVSGGMGMRTMVVRCGGAAFLKCKHPALSDPSPHRRAANRTSDIRQAQPRRR